MSFADNLRTVRKERNISQEDLAELLNVSRQAVSKWEQGIGYPEVEKMITLSKELNISLDYLMCDECKSEYAQPQEPIGNLTGRIMIKSQDAIVSCEKIMSFPISTRIFKCKIDEPQYALFGVNSMNFFGSENRTLLGWYASEESVAKEQKEIMAALKNGEASYELKYAAKVKRGFLSVKLDG